MNEKVRVGIIGTGFARKVQIPSFLESAEAEIVSVASGHLENAQKTAQEFNIAHFTDDWRETVERDDIDLICITTPPDTHREMTLHALEHGRHILCEKPMAMTADEAREMTEKAGAENVLALIDHELRFLHGRLKAFEIIRSGEIGAIRHAKCNFRNGSRGKADTAWNWWSDQRVGGGALGAVGSHSIDSLLWLLDAEVSDVFCQLHTHVKKRRDEESGEMREVTTDDEANLVLHFADSDSATDATGTISVSMVEYPDYKNQVELFGTKGSLRIEHRGELFIGKADAKDWRAIDVNLGKAVEGIPDTGFSRGFMNFAPKIVEAIQTGETRIEHAATFEDGCKIQKVLDAARKSNETGAMVKL
ncbi:MAG: Gfo/Idh/MocA family oxidoreductase [Acidobacteria bacterium]|nr:Gfo/Idh/MocA family oxidoreductase [Acidobacteriota bacterium]